MIVLWWLSDQEASGESGIPIDNNRKNNILKLKKVKNTLREEKNWFKQSRSCRIV